MTNQAKYRWIPWLLATAMMISMVACDRIPTDGTSKDDPSTENLLTDDSASDMPSTDDSSTDPNTSDEPKNTVLNLIVNGKTDYTLVYDDSDDCITAQVESFVTTLKTKHNVTLNAVPVSKAQADYGKEIVVGNVRESVHAVAEQLQDANDFAMCVSDDDWVLCATNSRLYMYLFLMVENRVLPKILQGNLKIESDNDFIYQNSAYKNKSYIDYALGSQNVTVEFLAKIFDARTFEASDGTKLAYRLYVPFDYDESKEYPVLLTLHGTGERGNDNVKNLRHILPQLFSDRSSPAIDAIIVCPQCPDAPSQWVDTVWANGSYDTDKVKISNELKAVMELLDDISADYSVDADRKYVMGLSMGGFATWDLLIRYSDYFAAGVPICGCGDPAKAGLLVDMPIWTFHGSADPSVPVAGTREMVAALKAAGSTSIKYEEFEGVGHNIWNTVASRKDVIKWLFDQDKSDRS